MIASVSDFREVARRRLPSFLFDYIDGGAYEEVTLRNNVAELQAVPLRQRVLRDVSRIDLSTTLFGQRYAMPVGLGPVGMGGFYARRGEVQAARAALAAGVPFCLSTLSGCAVEEVVQGCGEPVWFQFYMIRDRGFTAEMLARLEAAGVATLVFTVDLAVPGARYRDVRSGHAGPPSRARSLRRAAAMARRPAWIWDVGLRGGPHVFGNIAPAMKEATGLAGYWEWVTRNFDPSATWDDLAELRARWKGPLVVKGILDPDDARRAVEAGADGMVVSNHGGRQLDGAPATIRALPAIVEAVGARATILMDGGVRSGADVLRALAMGAKGVLLGRAWAYALAAGGQAGVARMLGIIRAELEVAMALTAVTRIEVIDAGVLATELAPPATPAAEAAASVGRAPPLPAAAARAERR